MATPPTACSRSTISSSLVDDRHFFPPYEAAALVGARLARDAPGRHRRADAARAAARRVAHARAQPARRGRWRGRDARRAPTRSRDSGSPAHGGARDGAEPRRASAYWDRSPPTSGQRRADHRALVLRHLAARRARARRRDRRRACRSALALERARRAAEPVIGALGVLADDPEHRAARVHDPAARHRREAGARGALALRALSDRAQHLHAACAMPTRRPWRPRRRSA